MCENSKISKSLGIQDLSYTFFSKILTLVLAIGTQSCLAWFLGPQGRGSYAVCIVFTTLLTVFFAVGCDIATVYFVSSKRFTVSEGVTHAFIFGGIGSVLAVVVGLLLMQLPLSFLEKAARPSFYLALALIPSSLFSVLLINFLTSVQRFDWFGMMSVTHALAHLLLTLLFIWILPWGVAGALLANILRGILITIIITVFLTKKYSLRLIKPSLGGMLNIFNYGLRYYIGKVSNNINFQIGTILLAFFATREDVGLFAVASQLTIQATVIPDSLNTVLIPKVSANSRGKECLVAQCSRLTGICCGVLLLLLIILAKPIVFVLFSPAFLPAVPIIQIISLGIFVRCVCKLFVPYLLGTDHPGIVSISTITGTIVNFLLICILLPIMGLSGAALAMVAGYIVSSSILTIGFARKSHLGIREIWHVQQSDSILIVNACKYMHHRFLGNHR